jgi:putative membrane protein
MHAASQLLTALVALEHVWFLVLEMFLFTKPIGLKTFRLKEDFARQAAPMMQNQGLYNGFLAAGLLWALLAQEPAQALQLKTFFLGCVVVAGAFGALTISRRILYLQAFPAALALALSWLSARGG